MRNNAGSHGTRGAFFAALVVLVFAVFLFTGLPSPANAIEMQQYQYPVQQLPKVYEPTLQQTVQPLDIKVLESQKINPWKLPNSQLISNGTVTKSIEQIKQELSLLRAQDSQFAISYWQLDQSNYNKQRTELFNRYAARDIANREILSKMLGAFPKLSIPPNVNVKKMPIGTVVNPPGPPIFNSIDKSSGQKGEAFLIQGQNFSVRFVYGINGETRYVTPRVIILVADGVQMDANVQIANDTQIIATVPDTTGYPGYRGYIFVETKIGKSNFYPFTVVPDREIVNLDSDIYPHTLATCNWCSEDNYSPKPWIESSLLYTRPPHDHLDVIHDAITTGCSGRDSLWQGIKLRNGWVVDTVTLYKVTEDSRVTAQLSGSPVGTDNPHLTVNWSLGGGLITGLGEHVQYYAAVIISGPKGTSWK